MRTHDVELTPMSGLGSMIDLSGKGGVKRRAAAVRVTRAAPAAAPNELFSRREADSAAAAIAYRSSQLELLLKAAKTAAKRSDKAKDPALAAILRTESNKNLEKAKIVARSILEEKGRFLRATVAAGAARAIARAPSSKRARLAAAFAQKVMDSQATIKIPLGLKRDPSVASSVGVVGRVREGESFNEAVAAMQAGGLGSMSASRRRLRASRWLPQPERYLPSVTGKFTEIKNAAGLPLRRRGWLSSKIAFAFGQMGLGSIDDIFLKDPGPDYSVLEPGSSLLAVRGDLGGLGAIDTAAAIAAATAEAIRQATKKGTSSMSPELQKVACAAGAGQIAGLGSGLAGLGCCVAPMHWTAAAFSNAASTQTAPASSATSAWTGFWSNVFSTSSSAACAASRPKKGSGSAATDAPVVYGMSLPMKIAVGAGVAAATGGVVYLAVKAFKR